jgi:hexosaminidase
MEATVDLGDFHSVRKLKANSLQDDNPWVFLPQEVEHSLSSHGEEYRVVAKVHAGIPPERAGIFSLPFQAVLIPNETRFVRDGTTSVNTCPDWRKGAGGPAWIFADEIVVE